MSAPFAARSSFAARANKPHPYPLGTLASHHLHLRPHHKAHGVDRSHLPTLALLAGHVHRAGTSATHPQGALMTGNQAATTIFFDNMESGAPGWTTIGDTLTTPYYTTGHDFWSLAANPETQSVPGAVNPALVSYPDTAGALPAAYSGTHAWQYDDTPASDPVNPSGTTQTYMGNQSDWPYETNGNGGQSNGANHASLISPSIDLTSASNATLTFATWWEIESVNPAHFDQMEVDVSTDGGTTFSSTGVLNPTNNPAGGADAYPYTDNGLDAPASWQIASVNLTPYIGHQVKLRFRFDTIDQYDNGFRGWFIDDVGVYSNDAGSPIIGSVSPNSGVAGDTVTISGSNFGATQGSGGVTINNSAAAVQTWSASAITITIPAGATSGPLVVTNGSGAQSSPVAFTVTASLALSEPSATTGSVDSVSGAGFAANESVAVYVNGVNGVLLATGTANGSGHLSATAITIPPLASGSYPVLAIGQTSHLTAADTLSIVPALASAVTKATPGQMIALTASGFGSGDAVSIYLDTLSGTPFDEIYCDANGLCSGTVTLPSSGVLQGRHLLIAIGAINGALADATITINPEITLSPTSGGPGTGINLYGAGFSANENVQVFWGTTSGINVGEPMTDSSGNLFLGFFAPNGLTPGKYTVTVARTGKTPATVTKQFQVLAPKLTLSHSSILSGHSVDVSLVGFQGYENVTLSWNANGGQTLTDLSAYFDGSASATVTPPVTAKGTYTLTATGDSSGIVATRSLTIGAGIVLSPSSGNPGGPIVVTGGGFTPGETVNVYFQTTATGVTPVTVGATGTFSVTLTAPTTYKTTTTYYVHAVSTTSAESAKALFTFLTPSVFLSPSYAQYGLPITLSGQGFLANESVRLWWNYQQAGQTLLTTVTAAPDGTFSYDTTVPSDPNLGIVNFAAIGLTSGFSAVNSVYEYAALVMVPSGGAAGTLVTLTGGGFAGSESVTVTFQNATVATVTANAKGHILTSFTVPSNAPIGYATVQATGATSNVSASAPFEVEPSIMLNPTTGPAGTSVAVTGSQFTPSGSVDINWYDPSSGNSIYLGTFSADTTGALSATVTVPDGQTPGATYYIQAFDISTDVLAQAAFVAQ